MHACALKWCYQPLVSYMCQIHRKLNTESMNIQFLLYKTHGMKERIVRVGGPALVVVYHHSLNAGSSS